MATPKSVVYVFFEIGFVTAPVCHRYFLLPEGKLWPRNRAYCFCWVEIARFLRPNQIRHTPELPRRFRFVSGAEARDDDRDAIARIVTTIRISTSVKASL